MSARLILHIILSLVLFTVGWWLYMSIGNSGALDSIGVATYWFAMLVYMFFSWLFYWVVHRLRLRVWVIMQILAILISAVSTGVLLYVSREHQKQVEEKAIQEQLEEEVLGSGAEQDSGAAIGSEKGVEVLNLSEEEG
ncbi:MAG: hypothetical protein AB8B92_02220 [Gammaproteobacteria bacterium]